MFGKWENHQGVITFKLFAGRAQGKVFRADFQLVQMRSALNDTLLNDTDNVHLSGYVKKLNGKSKKKWEGS